MIGVVLGTVLLQVLQNLVNILDPKLAELGRGRHGDSHRRSGGSHLRCAYA